MPNRDLDIIIIAGEFVCFRLRLTMDTMPSGQHMREFGRKSSSFLKRMKHLHFFTREAGRPLLLTYTLFDYLTRLKK
jgi:hypothetical protein